LPPPTPRIALKTVHGPRYHYIVIWLYYYANAHGRKSTTEAKTRAVGPVYNNTVRGHGNSVFSRGRCGLHIATMLSSRSRWRRRNNVIVNRRYVITILDRPRCQWSPTGKFRNRVTSSDVDFSRVCYSTKL